MAEDNQPVSPWKDPKQGGFVATVAGIVALLSSLGINLVQPTDAVTENELEKFRAQIIDLVDKKDLDVTIRMRDTIAQQLSSQSGELKSEIKGSQRRLDELYSATVRIGAMIEQHMVISGQAAQRFDPLNQYGKQLQGMSGMSPIQGMAGSTTFMQQDHTNKESVNP